MKLRTPKKILSKYNLGLEIFFEKKVPVLLLIYAALIIVVFLNEVITTLIYIDNQRFA